MNILYVHSLALLVSVAAADPSQAATHIAGVDAAGHVNVGLRQASAAGRASAEVEAPQPGLPYVRRESAAGAQAAEAERPSPASPLQRGASLSEASQRSDGAEDRPEESWGSSLSSLLSRWFPPAKEADAGSASPIETDAAPIGLLEVETKVDCNWGPWAPYTACSSSCGSGSMSRSRAPAVLAQRGGAPCEGHATEVVPCDQEPCEPIGADAIMAEVNGTDEDIDELEDEGEGADAEGEGLMGGKWCVPGKLLNPPENMRRYSSIWGNNRIGTGHARSMLDSHQAWSARWNNRHQWMYMDLGSVQDVMGVVIQGRHYHRQYVTRYRVKYSTDARSWKWTTGALYYRGEMYPKLDSVFPNPVRARYIMILPTSWHWHISLRAGVRACGNPTERMRNPRWNYRSYSSLWSGHWRHSELGSSRAWIARYNRRNQWMTMDMRRLTDIKGTIIQGRYWHWQWVTRYKVYVSANHRHWTYAGTFNGNRDNMQMVYNYFGKTHRARWIRIYVLGWRSHISMRAGVIEAVPASEGSGGGSFQGLIRGIYGGYCLSARGGESRKNGGRVVLWYCSHNNAHMTWNYNSNTGLLKVLNGNCLTARPRYWFGGRIYLNKCNENSWDQKWYFDWRTRHWRNRRGMCIDMPRRRHRHSHVHIWRCTENNYNQAFHNLATPAHLKREIQAKASALKKTARNERVRSNNERVRDNNERARNRASSAAYRREKAAKKRINAATNLMKRGEREKDNMELARKFGEQVREKKERTRLTAEKVERHIDSKNDARIEKAEEVRDSQEADARRHEEGRRDSEKRRDEQLEGRKKGELEREKSMGGREKVMRKAEQERWKVTRAAEAAEPKRRDAFEAANAAVFKEIAKFTASNEGLGKQDVAWSEAEAHREKEAKDMLTPADKAEKLVASKEKAREAAEAKEESADKARNNKAEIWTKSIDKASRLVLAKEAEVMKQQFAHASKDKETESMINRLGNKSLVDEVARRVSEHHRKEAEHDRKLQAEEGDRNVLDAIARAKQAAALSAAQEEKDGSEWKDILSKIAGSAKSAEETSVTAQTAELTRNSQEANRSKESEDAIRGLVGGIGIAEKLKAELTKSERGRESAEKLRVFGMEKLLESLKGSQGVLKAMEAGLWKSDLLRDEKDKFREEQQKMYDDYIKRLTGNITHDALLRKEYEAERTAAAQTRLRKIQELVGKTNEETKKEEKEEDERGSDEAGREATEKARDTEDKEEESILLNDLSTLEKLELRTRQEERQRERNEVTREENEVARVRELLKVALKPGPPGPQGPHGNASNASDAAPPRPMATTANPHCDTEPDSPYCGRRRRSAIPNTVDAAGR